MMGATFLLLLPKSTVISSIGLLYYHLLLRNRKTYTYNRFFLLATVLASVIIPWLHFGWPSSAAIHLPSFQPLRAIAGVSNETDSPLAIANTHTINVGLWLAIAYGCVCTTMAAIMVRNVIRVFRLQSKYRVEQQGNIRLVIMDGTAAPFSFLHLLFWNERIPLDSEEGRKIRAHELTHINQYHSLDKLFVQLVLCFGWINPCYWMLRRELALQHEFIADEAAVSDGDTDAFARMLLGAYHPIMSTSITQSFFHSPIKRRLIMMMQPAKMKSIRLRKLLAVPLLLTTTMLFAFDKNTHPDAVKSDHKIVVALDAAHGGTDDGAQSKEGLKEKDLTLKISQRIAALAGEYNVTVINSRTSDKTLSLDERVNQVNLSDAELYIGLHINKQEKGGLPVGYDILVGKDYESNASVQRLAGAVSNQFETAGIRMSVKKSALKVLRDGHKPGIVVECGDIANEGNMARITDEKKLDGFCRQLLTAVVRYSNANDEH